MSPAPYLSGQYLLAMPGIGDPRFERSVIALCSHDSGGALGICVGREIDELGFHDLLDQFSIPSGGAPDQPVIDGGPVEPGRGFVLHSLDWGGQDTVDVASRWAMSGSIDVLRAIAGGKGPRQWLFALGYAGWGSGQLEDELTGHGWITVDAGPSLMFDVPPMQRWAEGMRRAGIDPRLLSIESGTA